MTRRNKGASAPFFLLINICMKNFKTYLTETELLEWSTISKNIRPYLERRGYKFLGRGVDQLAFLEPNGQVLKIFGTHEKDRESQAFTNGHKMFIFWSEYCKRHANNPFLPKFFGWEVFEYDNQKYLQIRMEALIPLDETTGSFLEELSNYAVRRDKGVRNRELVKLLAGKSKGSMYQGHDPEFQDSATKLIIQVGVEHFSLLYNTMADLGELGRKNQWGIDLHSGNFMHRHDGVPIIVDPWVSFT